MRKAFAAYLAPLRNSKWVVYCKRPFGGPEEVLRYLARYTHRVAISNRRLIAITGGARNVRVEFGSTSGTGHPRCAPALRIVP